MINTKQQVLEQVKQQNQPQDESLSVSPLIIATLLILVGLFAAALSVVIVSRSTSSPSNPFAAYTDILPGQPWANVEAYGTMCGSLYPVSENYEEACLLRPATGIFSRISISRTNDTVDGVVFTLRENALNLGEVALALGVESSRQRPRNTWFLDEIRAVVWMDAGRVNYFQPVRAIYLY